MSLPTAPTTPPEPHETLRCLGAEFTARWLQPRWLVITARGELDAANSSELSDFALRHADRTNRLVLDLSRVAFFGTAAFSDVDTLKARCAREAIAWALVPSAAVSRLLRICDPDSTLPVCDSLDAAVRALSREQLLLLKLVSEPS